MKPTSKVRSAIYVRSAVADESQIVRQIEAAAKAINDNGDTLVGVYAEGGQSGMTLNRPEFQRLMKDAKKGKFTKLYVRDFYRISRDFRKLQATRGELKKYGIDVVTASGRDEWISLYT